MHKRIYRVKVLNQELRIDKSNIFSRPHTQAWECRWERGRNALFYLMKIDYILITIS